MSFTEISSLHRPNLEPSDKELMYRANKDSGKKTADCEQRNHPEENSTKFYQLAAGEEIQTNELYEAERENLRSENLVASVVSHITQQGNLRPTKLNAKNVWRPFASYANIFEMSSRFPSSLLDRYETLYEYTNHPSVKYNQRNLPTFQNYQLSQNVAYIHQTSNSYPSSEPRLHDEVPRCEDTQGKFACEICGSAFPLQRLLSRHLKSHSFYKRYQCPYCGKGFNDTFDLKRHIRTHTGIKPFKCNHCEKSFTQRCSLEAHLTRVHGVVLKFGFRERRSKMYVCEACGQTFRENGQFIKHTATHHPESNDNLFQLRANGFV